MLNRSASLAMSTSVLKALPGKLDIKRHSPSILYLHALTHSEFNQGIELDTRMSVPPFYTENTCVKRPNSKRPKIRFQDQLLLNAGHRYCRMLQGEHFAILSTFIKLPFVIKIFVLSIFEWPFYTGFTVYQSKKEGKYQESIQAPHLSQDDNFTIILHKREPRG